jgi:LmbE family N-acetylglucosaminyl deacetylase
MSDSVYIPESAMAIVAHPDDIEFGSAGTLIRWASAGCRVSYVLVTSGDGGIADPRISRAKAMEIREAEQRAACQLAGTTEVVFLRETDGMVVNTLELRRRLVREIRRFRPEVVLTMDPTVVWARENYINHPDHRAVGMATLDAVFPASGQPHVFQDIEIEGYTAFKPRKVYAVTFGAPGDVSVNISSSIDQKIAALRCHKSQFNGWDPEPRVREWSKAAGAGKEMDYAEVFRVVTLEDDETWAKWKGEVMGRYQVDLGI